MMCAPDFAQLREPAGEHVRRERELPFCLRTIPSIVHKIDIAGAGDLHQVRVPVVQTMAVLPLAAYSPTYCCTSA